MSSHVSVLLFMVKQYFTESAQAKAFISFENKTFIMKRNSYTTEKDSNKDIIHKGISKIN